jgi:hypothetical protein
MILETLISAYWPIGSRDTTLLTIDYGKYIIDHKYNTCSPNLFSCNERGTSPLWKGVIWAAKVVPS